jgi:hypothetical protein
MIFSLNNSSRLSALPTARVTALISRKPEQPAKPEPAKPVRPLIAPKLNPKWALIIGIGD